MLLTVGWLFGEGFNGILETILELLHQIYGGETTLADFLDGLELLVEPFLVDVQLEIVSPFFMVTHTEGKTVLIIINIKG